MTLASIRSAFFEKYDFEFDPYATLYVEFRRLARFRHWKQGSNSRIFEKAWNQCFGSEIPVGVNVDKKQEQNEGDNEFSSMLNKLQELDLQEKLTKREKKAQRVCTEFTSYYGDNAQARVKWQALCRDCGIQPIPSSINQCKKVRVCPFNKNVSTISTC